MKRFSFEYWLLAAVFACGFIQVGRWVAIRGNKPPPQWQDINTFRGIKIGQKEGYDSGFFDGVLFGTKASMFFLTNGNFDVTVGEVHRKAMELQKEKR